MTLQSSNICMVASTQKIMVRNAAPNTPSHFEPVSEMFVTLCYTELISNVYMAF